MVNERISEWIKEGLKRGYSETKLKEMLIKKGFSKDEIEKGLRNPANKTLIIIIATIIIVAIIIAVYAFHPKISLSTSNPPEDFLRDCMTAFPDNPGARDMCSDIYYSRLAINENNTKYCEKIKDSGKQALCLRRI